MNIYIDLIAKEAITSPTDSTPAIRPDFSAPTTYPINLYFLRQIEAGGYAYVRFPNSVINVGIRSTATVEVARFTLMFRGAETSEIDTRFTADQIRQLLEALPTIGAGNVSVTAIFDGVLTVEFTGDLAGAAMPTMSARIVSSTPDDAELTITVLPYGKQQLTLKRPMLAQTSTWTEVTIGTTPGWTGTLDTTAVLLSEWENPVGDLNLEVSLTALSVRTANDGATVGDAVGRSGTDGQVMTSPGASGSALVSDNGEDSFLIASDGNNVYGRKFVPNDIGRTVVNSDGYVWDGTTITEIFDDGINNMARLSMRCTPDGIGTSDVFNYTLTVLPSDVYYSATANFTAADVGHVITGDNIPSGTNIASVINSQYVRISQRPTAISVASAWAIAGEVSNVFTSASGVFQSGDVGAKLRAPAVLDGDATIVKFISPTQVVLDRQPTATLVSVQWTVIPVRPYPPALVSRLITGNVSTQEVQKIALAQAAMGGTLSVQDGYGASMPVAVVSNPVGTSGLQRALKLAYSNYGDLSVQEVVPGAEWNVIFGNVGGQRLLSVDESQAIYEGTLLSWTVANKSPDIPDITPPDVPTVVPTVARRFGLAYIGADPNHLSNNNPVGMPRVSRITDGTNALMLRYKIMTFTDQYIVPGMNQTIAWNGKTFYFIGDEGGSDRNGLYTADFVAVTLPASRTERHNQQRTILVPLWQTRGTLIVEWQLVSTSVSTWVDVKYTYFLESNNEPDHPPDSPFAVVVHFAGNWVPVLWSQNGFNRQVGNWGQYVIQGWSRRRWMGHIWEQKAMYN